jgi:type IV secretion system protein TrbG
VRVLGIMGGCSLVVACAARLPAPALPDPPTVFADTTAPAEQAVVLGTWEPPMDLRPLIPRMVSYQPRGPQQSSLVPRPGLLSETDTTAVLPRSRRTLSPEAVIKQSAQEALIRPSATNYFGGGASTRYTYHPDKVFEVVTSVDSGTVIRLPVGEHLMHEPVLNPELWAVGGAVSGEGPTRQEAIIVRPAKPGLSARMPLLCASGRPYYVLLRSTETVSMAEVTWVLSAVLEEDERFSGPRKRDKEGAIPVSLTDVPPAPRIDITRIHTPYTIEATKGKPPWMPASIYDDGSRMIIVFRESLHYTVAPAVFVLGANGKPAIVETTPWEDGVPGHGAYYVISGLYAVVLLKDGQGNEVTLTRIPLQPPPYREVSRAPVH